MEIIATDILNKNQFIKKLTNESIIMSYDNGPEEVKRRVKLICGIDPVGIEPPLIEIKIDMFNNQYDNSKACSDALYAILNRLPDGVSYHWVF